ncbi:MAG: single-stranded DNA-binding protein [Hyphomicrobiaceae bacterium]|nr:MAG: single-stranded DNA-binding protein [Hyphomicrobiaceae bacterium]
MVEFERKSTMNSVNIIGKVQSLELKYTAGGKAMLKGTITMPPMKKDGPVQFIEWTAWESTAENIDKYFQKGKKIGLTGNLIQEVWNDRETGSKRSKLALVVRSFTFCESKSEDSSQPDVSLDDCPF